MKIDSINRIEEIKRLCIERNYSDKDIYKYNNKTIIEKLDIKESEMKNLKCIISKEEKYRRMIERKNN